MLRAVEEADEDLALLHQTHFFFGGAGDLDDEVSLSVYLAGVLDHRGSGLLVVLVEVVVTARPGLDEDLEPFLDEPANGLGYEPDPLLAFSYLPRNPYLHAGDYRRECSFALTGGDRYQQDPIL